MRLGCTSLDRCRLASDEVAQSLARAAVKGVEQLIQRDERVGIALPDQPTAGDRLVAGRSGLQGDVAVGASRERVLVHVGHRPVVQRGEVRVQGDLHLGLSVIGQSDPVDGPDDRGSDHHLVACDQTAGVLEVEPHRVRVAPAEEQHDEDDDGHPQRPQRKDPSDHALPSWIRSGYLLAVKSLSPIEMVPQLPGRPLLVRNLPRTADAAPL